jgi:uncharacterized membrane protein
VTRFPQLCAAAYLAVVLPLLLTLALVTPPWQNPDEPLHLVRIVQIAHGGLIGSRIYGTAGGYSDAAIYDAYRPVAHASMRPDQRLSRQDIQDANKVQWGARIALTSFPNTVQYPPPFYVPAVAAYWAGRAGHLSIDHTLLLVRLTNAILFAAITAAATALAGRTRPLLVAILLLPTTLSLACAAGQDSLLFASTALAVAILDRIIAAHRAATRAETLVVAALLVCIAAARPPYAGFLLALLLLDPKNRAKHAALISACAAAVLAWCAVVALHVSVKLGGGDMHRQIAFIAAHPGQILPIIALTFQNSGWKYWQQLIGVLGWTDTPLPTPYILAQTLVLCLAAAACGGTARRQAAPAAGIAFAILTIFVLQWLTWTWPGQIEITGVLGRYFVPVVMVAGLALPARKIPYLPKLAWAAIAAAACVTPVAMIHAEIIRYYLS